MPGGIAWLYPLITDGLALVAYGATARLTGSGPRYAWAVVVVAAGLSGLAQAAFLASGATLDASPVLRFGIGAWPAVAAAIAAHLLYLLTADHPVEPHTGSPPVAVVGQAPAGAATVTVQPVLSNRPDVQPELPAALNASDRPPPARAPRPTPSPTDSAVPSNDAGETPARVRARAAAMRHAARNGALPTVSALAAAADVSRGTAATVLKLLRGRPLPLHVIHTEPTPTREPDDNAIEERNQP